jgi:hypothetical protein
VLADGPYRFCDEDVAYLRFDSWMELPLHPWSFVGQSSSANRAAIWSKWLLGETINQSMGCAADINYFGLLENSIDVPPIELFHERVSHLQLNENIQIVL